MIETLIQLLRFHEGVRKFPYTDTVGKLTIGVGRNLTDVGLFQDEIDYLLSNDINRCIRDLRSHLYFFDSLDEVRKIVLVDMCFNLGIGGLMKFQRTLKAVEEGRYQDASFNMLDSKWATQVGDRAIRLSEMMRTGMMPVIP